MSLYRNDANHCYTKNMNRGIRLIFWAILIFSLYHLIRDLFQIFNVNGVFINIFHRDHLWCAPYCDDVTLPLDLFGLVGSSAVIKRNKLGLLGKAILLTIPLWVLATLPP